MDKHVRANSQYFFLRIFINNYMWNTRLCKRKALPTYQMYILNLRVISRLTIYEMMNIKRYATILLYDISKEKF